MNGSKVAKGFFVVFVLAIGLWYFHRYRYSISYTYVITPGVINRSVPLILDWFNVAGFASIGLSPPFGACLHPCAITRNRSLSKAADAIVFHVQRFKWDDVPPARSPKQIYAYFSTEAPPSTAGKIPDGDDKVPGFFNWTMTYRLDSDVVTTFSLDGPIGYFDGGRNRFQLSELDIDHYISTKKKPAMWIASHCGAVSRRDDYIRSLRRYIDVSIFGSCLSGNRSCSRPPAWYSGTLANTWCVQRLKYDYFFYLAFENAICKDYNTEKLHRAVKEITVPVVLSRSVARAVLPDGGFIAVDDFNNASALAQHLNVVIANRTLYKQYFNWRLSPLAPERFRKERFRGSNFCSLCDALHTKSGHKNIHNMHKFIVTDANCSTLPHSQFQ